MRWTPHQGATKENQGRPASEQHPYALHPPSTRVQVERRSPAPEHGTVGLILLMNSAESLSCCNLKGKLNASYFQVILNPEGDTIVSVLPGAFLRGLGFVTLKLGI